MKSEFKAKLVNHLLNKKNAEKGFTLIELLVVIIIIGILAAIALPSFLNQANKARQSEAKTYTGSMNRSQQAYYLEKSTFATQIDILGLGIKTTTENYGYTIAAGTSGSGSTIQSLGSPSKAALKGYAGTTWLGVVATGGEATTLAILCESTVAPGAGTGITSGSAVAANASVAACATGLEAIK
jgi:type IV pilus assembly protein PilA